MCRKITFTTNCCEVKGMVFNNAPWNKRIVEDNYCTILDCQNIKLFNLYYYHEKEHESDGCPDYDTAMERLRKYVYFNYGCRL